MTNGGHEYHLRIATWNLEPNYPNVPERKKVFRKMMAAINADVWVLTETWLDFSPGEEGDFKLVAQSDEAVDLKTWPDRRWVVIWVKKHLEAKEEKVGCQPDRMVCARIEKVGQRDVVVVGTVLPWGGDPLFPTDDDYCAALTAQAKDWERRWESPRTSGLIVAGDFNQSLPFSDGRGSERGEIALESALKRTGLRCLTEGPNPLSTIPRIDHICVSERNLISLPAPPFRTWPNPCVRGRPITNDYHHGEYADLELLPNS